MKTFVWPLLLSASLLAPRAAAHSAMENNTASTFVIFLTWCLTGLGSLSDKKLPLRVMPFHFKLITNPHALHYRAVGRGRGVGRGLGVTLGVALGVGLAVGVPVGVGLMVALGVGVGIGP